MSLCVIPQAIVAFSLVNNPDLTDWLVDSITRVQGILLVIGWLAYEGDTVIDIYESYSDVRWGSVNVRSVSGFLSVYPAVIKWTVVIIVLEGGKDGIRYLSERI